jgi:hypothetical protein
MLERAKTDFLATRGRGLARPAASVPAPAASLPLPVEVERAVMDGRGGAPASPRPASRSERPR